MAPPVGEAAQGHGDVIAVSVPADAQAADVARAMAEAARRDGVPGLGESHGRPPMMMRPPSRSSVAVSFHSIAR